MSQLPVVAGLSLEETVAWTPQGPRTVRELLASAEALASAMPASPYLLNLCQDRYHFAVVFMAGLIPGRVSLQPSSQSAETMQRIQRDFQGVLCVTDVSMDAAGLPCFEFEFPPAGLPALVQRIPELPADKLAAVLFTSGSTGVPQPHQKTWGKLVRSGRVEAERLGARQQGYTIVGTVPVQHSFGFESTFLMALHGGVPFWSGKPFYPLDIVEALAAAPAPRLLVTTPYHLSTLLAAGVELPPTAAVLSATAPLSQDLARQAEERFQAPVFEIYGSTETGQLASRRTTDGPGWTLLEGTRLEHEGDMTLATDGHVEGRVPLSDVVEKLSESHFLLHGRHADMVNIAGKRTSLAYLNHQICAIAGVCDAAFYWPDPVDERGVERLVAFVVAPELDRESLIRKLRQRVDVVFMPRPLVWVDALPRNSTGKLPRQLLTALYTDKVLHG
jgi:acyl-coenzyme A synthetase/AMP-(fatty) acid ligase